jgi:DNA-binding CsgD family transcriptional regulator
MSLARDDQPPTMVELTMAPDQADQLDLIQRMYAAAEDPIGWQAFLAGFGGVLRSAGQPTVHFLLRHLQRAMRVHARLNRGHCAGDAAADALDAVGAAIFVVTHDGAIRFANRCGAGVSAGNGISTAGGVLGATTGDDTARLREACRRACSSGDGETDAIALTVAREGSAPLTVLVLPFGDASEPATAMVLVTDPLDERLPNEALLQAFYGLSPAEARVAGRLATGDDAEAIAETLGYTRETLRWYSKQVLAKTGCRSRSDLVRTVAQTVASPAAGQGAARVPVRGQP